MKTLPEKINTDTAPKILTLYCSDRINQLIDYLQEREEAATTPVVEEWPRYSDEFFFIDSVMEIDCDIWEDAPIQLQQKRIGNIFRTCPEAAEKLAKITKVLGE